MKKLFKALAILTSFSVLTRAFGFLFRIFLSRNIGAEGLGIYQISFSIYMVLETFVSSGLPLVVSKKTSNFQIQNKVYEEKKLISSALVIGITTATLLCLIISLSSPLLNLLFTDKRCLTILLILLPALIFSSVYAVLRGNLWGHKKYFFVSLTEFLEQIIRIIFAFLFLIILNFSIDKAYSISIAYTLSCFFSAFVTILIFFNQNKQKYKKKGQLCPSNAHLFIPILKESTPITTIRILSSFLSPLISLIIPFQLIKLGYTNEQAISILGIAMGMTFPILYIPSTLVSSLSITLIPDLSTASIQNNSPEISSKINFSIKFGYFVSFLFIPIFFALGEYIGLFLYNNLQAGIFLKYASPIIIPICLSGITVSCLNALNMEVKGFINYIIGAFSLLFCIVFLTPIIGIYSLIIGMGLCLGIASFLNILLLQKKTHYSFLNLTYLFKGLVISIFVAIITKWIYKIISLKLSLFFSLTFSILIGEICFLLLALVVNLYNLSFLKTKGLFKSKNKNINTIFKKSSKKNKQAKISA